MRCCFAPFPKVMCVVVLPPSPKWHAWLFCPLPHRHMMAVMLFLARFGLIGRPWEVLGSSISLLGHPWGVPGGSFSLLGRAWEVLGGSSGDLWASREAPWMFLGRPWWVPGGSWGSQGGSWGTLGSPRLSPGRSWRDLGGPQGAPGGVFERQRRPLKSLKKRWFL